MSSDFSSPASGPGNNIDYGFDKPNVNNEHEMNLDIQGAGELRYEWMMDEQQTGIAEDNVRSKRGRVLRASSVGEAM